MKMPPQFIIYLLSLFDNIAFKSLKFWIDWLDPLFFYNFCFSTLVKPRLQHAYRIYVVL